MGHGQATRIMIVEDERIVARDLQMTLIELEYDAYAIAASAEQALARASETCPDLVLMDIRIQGTLDGISTAQILRERFGVPVVYLTAHSDDATLERAKVTEPHGYLIKPVKATELRSAIEVSLYKHAMELRLRERERWFATTLCSIADAVIAVDLAGRVTFINPAAETLLGCTSEGALGRPASEIVRLLDEHENPTHETPLDVVLRERRHIHTFDGNLLAASSEVRAISDSAALVQDAGKTLGAVMVFRDTTEQKRLQKQLEISERLSALGMMAAGVTHEVNNPLAVVSANAEYVIMELVELVKDPALASVAVRLGESLLALRELEASADRITKIVSDLRTFARPQAHSAAAGLVDVNRTIAWAVRSTSHELKHRALLSTDLHDVPPVFADETRLGQVVVNLLVNAAHAIAPGRAESNRVSIATRVDSLDRVVIEVRDTGHGMAPAVVARVFDPFFTTKDSSGVGLGLAISHGIVASLGGHIYVESQEGLGSLFGVLLPAAPRLAPQLDSPPALEADQRSARILVIDDEPLVLSSVRRTLELVHSVSCVDSAKRGIELIERERFDLILCDLGMPEMTGVELYEWIVRVRPQDARRVIFMTGGAITAELADFVRSVPNRCVDKPFGIADLLSSVQQALATL